MPEYSISYEMLASTFHLPVFEASHRLGVPPNVLYQLARETGHECWPAEKPARPTGRRYGQENGQQVTWMQPSHGRPPTLPHSYMGGSLPGTALAGPREMRIGQQDRGENAALQRFLPMSVHDGTPRPFYPPGRASHFQPYQGHSSSPWSGQVSSSQRPPSNQNHLSLSLARTNDHQWPTNNSLSQGLVTGLPGNGPLPGQGQGRAHVLTGHVEKPPGAQAGKQELRVPQVQSQKSAGKVKNNLAVSAGKNKHKQPSKTPMQASTHKKKSNGDGNAKKKLKAKKQNNDAPVAQVVSFGNDKTGMVHGLLKGTTGEGAHATNKPASLQLVEENLLSGLKQMKGTSSKFGTAGGQSMKGGSLDKDTSKKKKSQKREMESTFRTKPLWPKRLPLNAQARAVEVFGTTAEERKQLSMLQGIFGKHMPRSWLSDATAAD